MASSERIFKLLDEPVAIAVRRATPATARAGAAARGHIVFDHVWFAYNAGSGEPDFVLHDVSFEVQPGRARRHRRRHRRGQDDADQPAAAVLRRHARRGSRRRRRHPRARPARTCAACSASCCRTCTCSRGTIADNIRLGNAGDRRRARARGGARPCTPTRSSSGCRDGYDERRSPSAARRCRSGRSSCCRSRARWRSIRASWSSTRRRRASTPRPSS